MKTSDPRPHVVLVGTGGTIASSGSSSVDYHDYRVSSTVAQILEAVPEVGRLAELSTRQPINTESSKIGNAALLTMAFSVQASLDDPDVAAVIVTHGTDTLEETAFFLHLVVRTEKPIVVVGAMRPGGSLGADGPLNLYNAVVVATSANAGGKGVLVVANNHVFGARDVIKRDTLSVDALSGTKYGLLAEVCGDRVDFMHAPVRPHTQRSGFELASIKRLHDVDIMFDHQGAGCHLYRASVAAETKAIVVAGMGNGSLSAGARRGASLAWDAGIPFIRSTRTGQGIVTPLRSDAEFGIIAAGSLPPQKARILAIVAIEAGIGRSGLQAVFDEY